MVQYQRINVFHMPDLDIIGMILKLRADVKQTNATIVQALTQKGYQQEQIQQAIDLIEKDEIFSIQTMRMFTPINPIYYTIGVRKVLVEKHILLGLMKDKDEIGIRTIDTVNVEEKLVSATAIVIHGDKSELRIEHISKANARAIEKFFGYVIEVQRLKVINLSAD